MGVSRLAKLEAAEGLLKRALEAAEPREVAALVRESRMVAREIDEIRRAVPQEGSLNDELLKRRSAREAAAKVCKSAAGG